MLIQRGIGRMMIMAACALGTPAVLAGQNSDQTGHQGQQGEQCQNQNSSQCNPDQQGNPSQCQNQDGSQCNPDQQGNPSQCQNQDGSQCNPDQQGGADQNCNTGQQNPQ